jgi:hypothetical protein
VNMALKPPVPQKDVKLCGFVERPFFKDSAPQTFVVDVSALIVGTNVSESR